MLVIQKKILKNISIFNIFGIIYFILEVLYRGHSHPTMYLVGGLCGFFIGMINEVTPKMNILYQMLLGSVIITLLEFISGYILNIKLGLGIWDYSNLRFNFMGQICLEFWVCWFILSYLIVKLDDIIRSWK